MYKKKISDMKGPVGPQYRPSRRAREKVPHAICNKVGEILQFQAGYESQWSLVQFSWGQHMSY